MVFSIVSCHEKADTSDNTNNDLEQVEYKVISSAINQFLITPTSLNHRFGSPIDPITGKDLSLLREDVKMLLVVDSTIQFFDSISQYVHQRHNEIDTMDSYFSNEFLKANFDKHFVDNSQISSFRTETISSSEVSTLLDSLYYYGYSKIYKKYPLAYGIISLSRPAFNKQRDKAMLYIQLNKASTYGKGAFIWLKEEDKSWLAYDLVIIWES